MRVVWHDGAEAQYNISRDIAGNYTLWRIQSILSVKRLVNIRLLIFYLFDVLTRSISLIFILYVVDYYYLYDCN